MDTISNPENAERFPQDFLAALWVNSERLFQRSTVRTSPIPPPLTTTTTNTNT